MFAMLMRRRWLGRVTVVTAAVLLAGLGAAAYAAIPAVIPDADGTIHGCFRTTQGSLRVIDPSAGDSCGPSETALDWSRTGPQGPQGPQGPRGPAGPEGSGHAFTATSGGSVPIHGPTVVVTLTGLPAGTYLVWSPIEVVGDTESGTNNTCLFVVNDSTLVVGEGDTFMYDAKDPGFGRADMFAIITVPADGSTIATRCDANTDGAREFGRTTALKVAAVN
ncbi:hypothetical protein ACWDWO_23085 [Actinopolymorpha singaporensis]|uniref:Collagen triple helix repeat-containing protein n=1 Tax=Actinopolymorpha singaporensis TaxID=117157 RepID=A0A1H1TN22_9ACTN|nr:hypothetical protein [Actinopolymorpha singaporensis]SDS61461.1 hypothetical protein SAMN04489717_3263 [Actinopolymorpha singaporensis]